MESTVLGEIGLCAKLFPVQGHTPAKSYRETGLSSAPNKTMIINRIIIAAVNLWAYIWFFRVVLLHFKTCREMPNPAHPKTLNDKFLWRKLFDQNPAYISLSDKLESKQIAQARCQDILLPEVLWTGTDARDIPGHILAGDVIVKATHGSGFNFPIFAGSYDRDHLVRASDEWMRKSFGRRHWEWGYFAVKPKLFVEQLILDESGGYGTSEAKMYVYCGQIEQIVMIYDRQLESSAAVLRGDWSASTSGNTIGVPISDRPLPHNRAAIERVASQLCEGFDHMRCDLYLVGDDIYFGEYTVYNQGGYIVVPDDPEMSDAQSAAWNLRRSWFLSHQQKGLKAVYAHALLQLLTSSSR